jgi:hypothetical protein
LREALLSGLLDFFPQLFGAINDIGSAGVRVTSLQDALLCEREKEMMREGTCNEKLLWTTSSSSA